MPPDHHNHILRHYVRSFDPRLEYSEVTTNRMPVLPQAERVVVIPQDRPVCLDHSGVCAQIVELRKDVGEVTQACREQGKEIDRLRMLPWRVVGGAIGGGGGVAAVIELCRALLT